MPNPKKILLIHPSRKTEGKKDNLFTNESLVPSIGLASVAAYARANGIDPYLIDLRIKGSTINTVFDFIQNNKPTFVGLTAFTCEINSANTVAGLIKEKFSDLPIIVGGPHPTLLPEKTLSEFSNFDIAVIGEGERSVVELANAPFGRNLPQIEKVPGIALRRNGDILVNPPQSLIEDINDLPLPAWDLFDLQCYNQILPLNTSRGCPYRCYFCTPNYLGTRIRAKDYKHIVNEMHWLVDNFKMKRIQFADATLGLLKKDAFLLCDEIIASGLNKKVKWDCETRADATNLKLMEKMKTAGCEWVAIGVESGNERILRHVVKKGETKEQIENAVKLAKKVGIKVRCFFILGHHTETENTVKETIAFALQLNPDALSFGLMVPNPGSEVRKIAEQPGSDIKILHDRWEDYQQFNYNCFELTKFPLPVLKSWQAKAYFWFYLHHPLKALNLFLNKSAYNYQFTGIFRILYLLAKNLVKH